MQNESKDGPAMASGIPRFNARLEWDEAYGAL
jgi:hypothetical protein